MKKQDVKKDILLGKEKQKTGLFSKLERQLLSYKCQIFGAGSLTKEAEKKS